MRCGSIAAHAIELELVGWRETYSRFPFSSHARSLSSILRLSLIDAEKSWECMHVASTAQAHGQPLFLSQPWHQRGRDGGGRDGAVGGRPSEIRPRDPQCCPVHHPLRVGPPSCTTCQGGRHGSDGFRTAIQGRPRPALEIDGQATPAAHLALVSPPATIMSPSRDMQRIRCDRCGTSCHAHV